LNADGSLETAFDAAIAVIPDPHFPEFGMPISDVRSIVVQSDGKILIGGYFASIDSVTYNNIARLMVPPVNAVETPWISAPANSATGIYSLSWGSSTPNATYVVKESYNGGAWTDLVTTTRPYLDLSSKPSGTYAYQIKAIKAGYADSGLKTSGTVNVVLICDAPAPWIDGPASSATGDYSLWWGSSTPGATYTVQESFNGGAWTDLATTTRSFVYLSSKPSGTYAYQVFATKPGYTPSTSGISSTVTVLLSSATPGIDAPANSASGNYTVSWKSSTPGVSYAVKESFNGGAWTDLVTTTRTYIDLSSKPSGTYAYQVKATKSGYADSGLVTSGTVTVSLVCDTPNPWIDGQTNSTSGDYTVRWGSLTPGATYTVQESFNGGAWTDLVATNRHYLDLISKPTGTYAYQVKATRGGYLDSGLITSETVTVLLTCAAPGIDVPANPTTGTYSLSWKSSTHGATYVVQESYNGGGWTNLVTTTRPYLDLISKPSGTYVYQVKATKSGYLDSGLITSGTVTVL